MLSIKTLRRSKARRSRLGSRTRFIELVEVKIVLLVFQTALSRSKTPTVVVPLPAVRTFCCANTVTLHYSCAPVVLKSSCKAQTSHHLYSPSLNSATISLYSPHRGLMHLQRIAVVNWFRSPNLPTVSAKSSAPATRPLHLATVIT